MKKTKLRSFGRVNRRMHLYLALVLLPWFFMYGVSALAIHHRSLFRQSAEVVDPPWRQLYDRQYNLPVTAGSDLEDIGNKVLEDAGLIGESKVRRPTENRIEVERIGFWSITRFVYNIDAHQLLAEEQRFSFQQFLTRMHSRGGYGEGSWVNDLWAVMIDIVSVAMVIWVATGFYMWWKIKQSRAWGIVALVCGTASFMMLLFTL